LWVSRTYWQYGSEPSWVIGWAAALVIGCAFIYWLNGSSISDNLPVKELFTFGKALYFSTTTFTTVGYGDFSPLGGLRVITSIEAFLGIFSMGFLVAGYASKKY
jgi:voltage-gated potassium channel Kch